MVKKYTNEKNIQMLIYLLKKNNIKKIIINPGTMNMSFVASVQNDSFFQLYSCVDERSACYMACGLASETGEPVVLTCTGATASRNYMPGITEAFYRKLPIIAITCTPHLGNIGQNVPQMLDRRNQLNDTYKLSVYISPIKSNDDAWANNLYINNALLELKRHGGGPVHINLGTEVTKVFDVKELPEFRKINRYFYDDVLPDIDKFKNIGIFVGNHKKWSKELIGYVDCFCEKYNSVVLCDHTSNYFGKYKLLMNIISDQEKYESALNNFDLIIHIGDVTGSYMKIKTKEVWRVNLDGELRDTFKKLKNVFEMSEEYFFKYYSNLKSDKVEMCLYSNLIEEYKELQALSYKCDLPFSNLWIARKTFDLLPKNSTLHMAILNSLRSWNYFENKNQIKCYSNTGGFGIDGFLSTIIGASLSDNDKTFYGIVGDLAFFYDMNALGNRYISNNLRIILINNGSGTEFHNYSHPANVLGQEMLGKYIAADGHFGNKSKKLVKDYVENLGFKYLSASTKEEFDKNINYFISDKKYSKSIVFEVFTDSTDESEALYKIRTLKSNKKGEILSGIKHALPANAKNKLKKMLGK